MGRAIYYCFQCSQRVSDSDIDAGKGFRVGDRILCAACAPESVKSVTSKRMPAVPRPKAGSTAQNPKVALPESPPPEPRSSRGRMIALAGVLALLLIVGAILLLRRNDGDHETVKTLPVVVAGSGNAATPGVESASEARERTARADLDKALDFSKAHPDDWSGRLKGFSDVARKWDGTEAGRVAAKQAAAVKTGLQEKVSGWMAEVEETIAELLKSNQYAAAAKKVEELKPSHDLPEWGLALEKRAAELLALAQKRAEEETAKKADERKPEETAEGKAQLVRWEAAAAKASARDYAGAIADLERALPGLKEADAKSEAEGDIALLRKVATAVQEAIAALRQRPLGWSLTLQARDAGAVKRVAGSVLQIDADRVELRSLKDSVFVDWSDVTAATLADVAQKGPFDPRALAALCLLEGETEAARVYRAELSAKWWTYAEGAKARLPKPDPAERGARDLFASAEAGYRSMETRAAAIDHYRSLRADFGSTTLVKSYSERIARRGDAGKEYYVAPVNFRTEGSLHLLKSGRLESDKDSDDRDTNVNFAELEFAALPGLVYRCWISVGACCEETFLFYYQGSDLMDTDPKTKKKVAVEPGSGFAVPVKHSIRNLKKTHADHKPKGAAVHPKTAARWEWVEVTLPKYTAPGAKKLRFMTNQAGFSVGGAFVSALRKGPPSDAEMKEMEKLRVLESPPVLIDPDLVAWWTFDEGAGSTVTDRTGRGHTGKFSGDVKWVEGKAGGAIEAAGGTSGIQVEDAEDLRIPGDLTMAIWFRKVADTDWVCLMGRGDYDHRNYGLWLEPSSRKYMFQQYGSDPGKYLNLYGTKLVDTGKWIHLAVTVEQDLVKTYYNGDLDTQAKRSMVPWTSAAPLGLGYAMYHTALTGALDDARLYRRALSASEIRTIYEQTR
jgi:hypothetical protein